MKKLIIFLLALTAYSLQLTAFTFAQEPADLEFTLDINSAATAAPQIFKPNIDLSGRGFNRDNSWPQELAAGEVLAAWQRDIGYNGLYRLQYNLWEVNELAKDKGVQDKLLAAYEDILKKITDSGGLAIVTVFGTPAGLGRVLDKKSPPVDLRAFKEFVKGHIRTLSCEKKYNIWYEVWSAPDLDDFFLGRKQDYLNLYRAVATAVQELEKETKIHIPIGGPSASWWFQNFDGNTIVTPERSLIYELIRFCYHYRLPLDFISWHAYSTDPKAEQEATTYHKPAAALIRNWLAYFHFDRNTPLIVDEWNYDNGANLLPERGERANITASYILARLKNMSEAGIDNQVYFSLEDFHNDKENVFSNPGVFSFDAQAAEYKGEVKVTYNALRMLHNLGKDRYAPPKLQSEFVVAIAGKGKDDKTILIYNYIDPNIAFNYLSRNIATLNSAERKILLKLINTEELKKVLRQEKEISKLKATHKIKALLKKAQELNAQGEKFASLPRNLKVSLKNLKTDYLYQRYVIDASCSLNCQFNPREEKEISSADLYQETLNLEPYSVQLIILKEKPKEPLQTQ